MFIFTNIPVFQRIVINFYFFETGLCKLEFNLHWSSLWKLIGLNFILVWDCFHIFILSFKSCTTTTQLLCIVLSWNLLYGPAMYCTGLLCIVLGCNLLYLTAMYCSGRKCVVLDCYLLYWDAIYCTGRQCIVLGGNIVLDCYLLY